MSLLRHIAFTARIHRHGLATASVFGSAPHRKSSDLRVEKEKGFAVMYMNRKPVNSYSKTFINDITAAILDVESDSDMNGLIIASELPNIYSAGLDLTELYRKPVEAVREFIECLLTNWRVHYGSRLNTIAAINGHCLAGGAVTAALCDYRIMTNGIYNIGFIEAQRDVVLPAWLSGLVQNTIGMREAERAIQLGLTYTPKDALRIGLVDELVDDEDKLLERAREEMDNCLKITSEVRAACKRVLRGPMIAKLEDGDDFDESVVEATRAFTAEAVQRNIEAFMTRKAK